MAAKAPTQEELDYQARFKQHGAGFEQSRAIAESKKASGGLTDAARKLSQEDEKKKDTLALTGLTPPEDRGGDSVYVQYRDQLKGKTADELNTMAHDLAAKGYTAEDPVMQPLLRAIADETSGKQPVQPTEAAGAKETAEKVSGELKEQGAKSKEELKALGKKAAEDLGKVNTAYQEQMANIGSKAGKESAKAYEKQTAALDRMGGYAEKITELSEKGAADSPFVQRQIAAYNAEVEAASESAKADLGRKMAARGFSGSNEQILLEGKLDQDIARSKATGAVDIEGRYIQYQTGVLEFQSQLAFSEAQFFGNQFQAFSGIQIGIETAAAQAGAEFGTKAVGLETGLTQAGIASEQEFAKAAAGTEVGGAQFAAQMEAGSNALKESMRQFEKTFQFETEVKFPTVTALQKEQIAASIKSANDAAEKGMWGDVFSTMATIATIVAVA